MWARVIEILMAAWLAASPLIFRHSPDARLLWVTDLSCALGVAIFSILSFRPELSKLHLLNLAAACWLLGVGAFAAPSPPPPALQNEVMIGLLLLMFAIVPSHASDPPRSWLEFYDNDEVSADTSMRSSQPVSARGGTPTGGGEEEERDEEPRQLSVSSDPPDAGELADRSLDRQPRLRPRRRCPGQ
jgi:hypothetical protein